MRVRVLLLLMLLLLLMMMMMMWVLLLLWVRVHVRLVDRDARQTLCLDRPSAVDELWNAQRALPQMRLLPTRERGRLGDRERRDVPAAHHAHHAQRRLRLRARARASTLTPALGVAHAPARAVPAAAAAAAAGGVARGSAGRAARRRGRGRLDVRAGAAGRPELAIDADEAGRLEARGGREDVEPERRLDHELLRVRAAADRLGRVRARVEDVPDPLCRDGEELLPGPAPSAEEEGGDDEEARHRLALGVPARGGRAQAVADALVRLARVGVRLVVHDDRVVVGVRLGARRGVPLSQGLLVQGSEEAHGVSHGGILLDGANDKIGDRGVRQQVLPLEHMVEIMPY